MEGNQKEIWLVNLQAFLENRLTTPTYALASRAYPNISAPLSLQNTQGLLDGLSLSLQDNPNWIKSAWGLIQSHVKRTYQRFEDVKELLMTTGFQEARKSKGGKPHGEGRYRALSAVQDVYLAFCVVDATLKAIPCLTPIKFQREIRELVESSLPSLVCDCFPPLAPIGALSEASLLGAKNTSPSAYLQEALEIYRWQFWDLLRAWKGSSEHSSRYTSTSTVSILSSTFAEGTISSEANQRLEEYIQHTLKVRREAGGKTISSLPGDHGSSSSNGNAIGEDLSIQGMINSLTETAIEGMTPSFSSFSQSVASAGGSAAGPLAGWSNASINSSTVTAEMMDRRIRSFLHHIFPSRMRGNAHRHRCGYCGAPFDSDAAKNTHYRYHFHSRNALRPEEKVVRLLLPAAADFIEHVGDSDRSGYFPKVTLTLEEAYKGGANGAVTIRRGAPKPSGNR